MRPQILVYGNRKIDDMRFPFSTQAEKETAFLKLFEYLRKMWKVYEVSKMSQTQEILYNTVRENISRYPEVAGGAAIKLLTLRKKYEYEQWRIEPVPTKDSKRISTPVVLKPHWADVKAVRCRHEGSYTPAVTLILPNRKEMTFLLVPHMATNKDWDDLNAASHFITDALSTEWQGEMHNAEGLREALNVINELRHCLQYARFPETTPPQCSPKTVFDRVMRQAESVITKYSNTPIEKLVTMKRSPTTLEEAKEELARAKRCIGSLVHYLKQAGKTSEAQDVLDTYKLEVKEELA